MSFFCFLLVVFCVVNPVFSLDNGLALTPPMGWMTWQRFRCETDCVNYPNECINEDLIKSMADQMVSKGYLEAGYEYIIVDDCWASKERDSQNRLQGDLERFPNGMKDLADYVHSKGLKFGIYGDYGNYTCGGYPGSLQYLELDAQTWADWGVDYLKLDGCYVDLDGIDQGYGRMSQFLNQTGRPIVFSCSFPAYVGIKANLTAATEYCNLWRNYGDISDTFEDVKDIADWFGTNQKRLIPFAGPGHWNDPDMLIIGNFGLSLEESKIQMTIWAILAAPLIMSVDLRTISDESAEILQNPVLIKINQDPLGMQGEFIKIDKDIHVWQRIIQGNNPENTCRAIAFASYRTDGSIFHYNFKISEFINNANSYSIQNVWNNQNYIKPSNETVTAKIPPNGVDLYIICQLNE